MSLFIFRFSKRDIRHSILCLLLLNSYFLCAQLEVPGYDMKRIGVQNGIDNQVVTSIVKDRYDNIWFGTFNGLYRYDGFRTVRIDKRIDGYPDQLDAYIRDLFIEPLENHLFLCTKFHARIIDVNSGKVIPAHNLGIPDSLFNNFIQIEKSSGGDYFFGLQRKAVYKIRKTGDGRYDCQLWYTLPDCSLVTNMISDPDDPQAFWLLLWNREVWRVDPKGIEQYKLPQNDRKVDNTNGMLQLNFSKKGIFGWDTDRNLYRFNTKKRQFETAGNNITLYDLVPNLIAVDIAMRQRECLRCFIDLDINQVVLGTSLGLFIARKKTADFHTIDELREEEIRGIYTDSSGAWAVGAYSGLFTGNIGSKKVNKYPGERVVWGFLPLSRNLWMLGMERLNGFHLWNPLTNEIIDSILTDRLPRPDEASVLSLTQDFYGTKWAGTYKGLMYSHPDTPYLFHHYRDPVDGSAFGHSNIRRILVTRDSSVWFCTDDGLYGLRYDPVLKGYRRKNTAALTGKIPVSDVYEDRNGDLWVATKGKGIARVFKSGGPQKWYDSEVGLPENMVCRIESSHNDSFLWFSTHNGLSRLNVSKDIIHNFYEENGFPGNEFNSGASCKATDGSLFFGGVNGLIYFHPDSIAMADYRYRACVPYVQIINHGLDTLLELNPFSEGLNLDSYPELIEFVLGSNERIQPDKIRYRYRLIGLSDKWNYTTGDNKVKYVHLPPGQYEFQLQAIPIDGHYSSVYRLPLTVDRPFNETWWFWITILTALKVVVYLAYKYQIRQIRKEQLIRQQIADDLHDDIGNKLNIMGIVVQKVGNFLQKNGAALPSDNSLTKLFDLSRDTQVSLRTMIWAVDPSKDRLENLITRMQDFADDFVRPLVPHFSFTSPKNLSDRNLSLRVRHHLMLIYQELLANMVKHTHPTNLNVQLLLNGDTITMIIINLHRLDEDQAYDFVSDSRGKSTLNRRLKEIGASIEYHESVPGIQKITVVVEQIFKQT